jgi:hypothetical protein
LPVRVTSYARLALRNKANQLWHTDSTFKPVPALASVLSARVIPARGGETEYVSTRLAWERLEPALRGRLENSFAWHDYAHSRGKIASDLASPGARGAAAAMLAQGMEEPGERPNRALPCLARLRDRGHGAGGGAKAPR